MKTLILLVFLLLACSVPPRKLIEDFKPGSSSVLVNKQDSLLAVLEAGINIPKEVADELASNTWVQMANEIAPNNIVIRQHCLIDLINGRPDHVDDIFKNIRSLSYDGEIWAEGYTYYEYTMVFVNKWIVEFSITDTIMASILAYITNIESGFVKTSYMRGELCYPAPFGDLRDVPLNPTLQGKCSTEKDDSITIAIVTVEKFEEGLRYTIKGKPVGLNAHVPKDTFFVEVRNGIPNFVFYTGYQNKYKSTEDELLDMLDLDRIKSLKEH